MNRFFQKVDRFFTETTCFGPPPHFIFHFSLFIFSFPSRCSECSVFVLARAYTFIKQLLYFTTTKIFFPFRCKESVRFSSLQYLVAKPLVVTQQGEQDEIDVELENYVLLSPDNIPLDDKDKEKLQQVLERDPLSLIEYWSIDPDYDGVTFRSTWQDYRENVDNDNDPLHCVYKTRLRVPHKERRQVCIKAVDVFGFESQVVESV